jgi:hypothetical protein
MFSRLDASERRRAIVMYAVAAGVTLGGYLASSPWILVGALMLLSRFIVDLDD